MRSLAIATFLVACGPPPAAPGPTTPTRPSAPGTPAVQLPGGPPLATPGERMSYRLILQGIEIAAFALGVGDFQDVDGRRAIVVQSHARSVGLARLVAKIDDHFISWIDAETGRPLRFQTDEYATNSDVDIEHTVVDIAGRSEGRVPITFQLNHGAISSEPQRVALPEVWDYLAFLTAMRAWEAPVGSAIAVQVFRSRFLWHVDMTIAGREQVVTQLELGELTALRFDARTYKLTRDGARAPDSDERKFSIWISDDDGRVPLQIVARTDYGDIKMQIVDYQPGTGKRLRP